MSNGEHGWSVSTQVVIRAQSIDAFFVFFLFVCFCAVYVRDTATAKVLSDGRISKRIAFCCCVRVRDGECGFFLFFFNPVLPLYFLIYFKFCFIVCWFFCGPNSYASPS